MKKISAMISLVLLYMLSMVMFSQSASAYIDPSAMTYIVQLVAGIVIAGSAAFAFYFKKLKRKMKKNDTNQENYEQQEAVSFDNDDEFDIDQMDDSMK
ncbi:MAG: hypothetical protein GX096_05035 [Clostridiales bacterium]|nr:hypothetical protein [Clostridiales bacterium]